MSQKSGRKIVLLGILFTPVLYLIFAVVLILGNGETIADYQVPFSVLASSVAICELISVLYISNKWNIDEEESSGEIAKRLVKEIIRLAIYQTISIFGLLYFILSFI